MPKIFLPRQFRVETTIPCLSRCHLLELRGVTRQMTATVKMETAQTHGRVLFLVQQYVHFMYHIAHYTKLNYLPCHNKINTLLHTRCKKFLYYVVTPQIINIPDYF